MAEQAQKALEQFAKYADKLKQTGQFNEIEIRKIVKKIKQNEHKLVCSEKHVGDFRTAIDFEMKLIGELKSRRVTLNGSNQDADSEWFFVKRVNKLYKRGLVYFATDFEFNNEYFQFLKKYPSLESIAHLHTKEMLQRFSSEPQVFRKVASWYFHLGKYKEARDTLIRSVGYHPKNLEIYLDLFELETKNPDKDSIILRLKTYIDFIVEHNVVQKFLEEIILYLEKQDNMEEVVEYCMNKLVTKYSDNADVWNFVALRQLKGDYYSSNIEDRYDTLSSIGCAVLKFKEGLAKVPKAEQNLLWKHYLSFVTNLYNYYKPNKKIAKYALVAFSEAQDAEVNLNEEHYALWIDFCQNDEKMLLMKLEEGVQNCSSSELLWSMYLKYLMILGKWEKRETVFANACRALGPNSVGVWEIYISGSLLRHKPDEVNALYEKALNQPYDKVALHFKPNYLSWGMVHKGLKFARETYMKFAQKQPYSSKMHEEMYQMERMHSEGIDGQKNMEKVIDLWMKQFGSSDCNVYRARIEIIKERGGPNLNENLGEVYKDALAKLSDRETLAKFKELYNEWITDKSPKVL